MKRKTNAKILETLALIREAPRTRPELVDLMGSRQDDVNSWVVLGQRYGFVRIKGNRPNPRGFGRQAIEFEFIESK